MIIYISGKITGNKSYQREFGEAEQILRKKGHIVLNPAMLPKGMKRKQYMPICIAMLEQADAVYELPSAKYSAGAKTEIKFALYQEKILFENIENIPEVVNEN